VEHRVVALLTASGLKDPQATAERQDDLPILPADPAAAFARLRELGIVKI